MRLIAIVVFAACGRGPAPCYPATSDAERGTERRCRPSSGVAPSGLSRGDDACAPWWAVPAMLCEKGVLIHDGCSWRCVRAPLQ